MSARDAHRALIACFEDAIGPLHDLASMARPWFSATFAGQQHRFDFVATRVADVDAFAAAFSELEIPLHGAFVADARVVSRDGARLVLECLTVEDI